jgi:hypothetical protein
LQSCHSFLQGNLAAQEIMSAKLALAARIDNFIVIK